jgi:hypothetical protein
MKQILLSLLGIAVCMGAYAQADTTKPQGTDTIKVGGIIIIKKQGDKETKEEKTEERKDDDDGVDIKIRKRKEYKPSNMSTNWFIFDLGFANMIDNTNYGSPAVAAYLPGGDKNTLSIRPGKSINFNMWIVSQRINLIKHVVNLKYAIGLETNNYRYEKNIRYRFEPNDLINTDTISFNKNKLAADYLTVPVMLNFNFTPKRHRGYGFSAGVSAGYLYASRQKLVSDARGKEKIKNDFNLNPWKFSAVGELNLGIVHFYGSYALNNLYRNILDITPYNVGLRLSSW